MQPGYHIQYLRREEIDIPRWDDCVINAPNGWLYARSFFLDGLGRWAALIAGDYDFLLPLPERTKYGIPYIYLPPFTGQLGIIGASQVSHELSDLFIRAIPASFRLADFLFNEHNPTPTIREITIVKRTNYILPLEEGYTTLYDRYTADAKKNLRGARKLDLSAGKEVPMEEVVRLYRTAYGRKNPKMVTEDYSRITRLGELCLQKGQGFTLGIRNPQGALLAAGFFGKDEKRIYYILGAPGQLGRRSNAVHCLIDEVIKEYAGTGLVFDFEGSDIPSVASFYRKFSPVARDYDFIHYDRLPRWLQWYRRLRPGKP